MAVEKKKLEGIALAKDWSIEESLRRQVLPRAVKTDLYYNSSRDHLDEKGVDLSDHGKSSGLLRKGKKPRPSQFDYSRGMRNDASLLPPIRQTASIFKQPVTVIRTQKDVKVHHEIKHGVQNKPKQLFWEKRLEGLRACDVDGREFNVMELPRGLKTIGNHIADETILQSIATALHLASQPVTGQTSTKNNMEKNPGVFINPEQPLVQAMNVNEDDIKRQEDRVLLARKKLKDALLTP